ncbi:MAG: hypothetical protein WB609_00140 [Candidatus Cybelea sp.]
MGFRIAPALLSAALLAGCSTGEPAPAGGMQNLPAVVERQGMSSAATTHPSVYWTLFASCSYPQIQWAAVPLKSSSKAKSLFCSSQNGVAYSSGLHVDSSGRLWVLIAGKGSFDPGSAAVFKLPLKAASTPQYTFILKGTNDPDHLTFDAAGNLWVSSHQHGVTKYKGPFDKSGTRSPVLTLTSGITQPAGIALDTHGNVYVSNFAGGIGNSIAVFTAPVSKTPSYYLKGLTMPGGLIFDKHGNLYASENGPSQYGIARYNSNDLKGGSTPSIFDSTDLSGSYESDFALSPTGDLYFANCGNAASIYVYPTSKKSFSSSLAPSVDYTNSDLQQDGCAWGIAIK